MRPKSRIAARQRGMSEDTVLLSATGDVREVAEAWDKLPDQATVHLLVRIFLFSIESIESRQIQKDRP